jgi:hypothetical protein
MRTLVIPPAAQRDDDAVQMLSAWIAEKGLHCSLNVGMWKAQGLSEPDSWGILLADVIRHLASAIEEKDGTNADTSVEQIVQALTKELDEPTSKRKGGFHPGHT